jgi:hypothetical protein
MRQSSKKSVAALRGPYGALLIFMATMISSSEASTRNTGMFPNKSQRSVFQLKLNLKPTAQAVNIFPIQTVIREPMPIQSSSEIPITTDAANLAIDFEKALVAVNQNQGEIHVGHLLSACERLEITMRKIGFGKGANDIAGNMAKIRAIYHKVSTDKRNSMSELLRYEQAAGIHDGKSIKNSSATMGLLWLGRSLNYQYDMFRHMLDHNGEPYEAACYAYENSMKPHLSWPVQKVCQTALKKVKVLRRKKMLAGIGGFSEDCFGNCEDQATRNDLRQVVRCLEPMICRWRQVFSEMGLGEI